ncbi:MAG: hypothetical protein MJZ81_07200 [Bacteroidales bacterium]|nr:hypothetical protein [Bacteroidales bacterium]
MNAIRSLASLSACLVFLASGCGSTGSTFRFEQRKNIGMTSVQVGGYDIPVLSISEGPSATAFQSRDAFCFTAFEGVATTTNRTSALGIYLGEESKALRFNGVFVTCPTNATDFSFVTNLPNASVEK